jgi:DNA-binding NarL/FixJ family response regulator
VTMCCLHAQAIAHGDVDAAAASRDHALRHALAADAGRALGLVGTLRGDAAVLEAAYRELGAIGAVRRQRVVAFELRRTGHRVPHSPAGGEAFSPVEVELVGLVTAGLTNRAVAERMGLSAKTVEVYLSRIYRKTGLRSRVELAVAAHDGRLGHLPDV